MTDHIHSADGDGRLAYSSRPQQENIVSYDEKKGDSDGASVEIKAGHDEILELGEAEERQAKGDLVMTAEDLLATEQQLSDMSLDRCYGIIAQMYQLHQHDQNFPSEALYKMKMFLDNPEVAEHPDKHADLVLEMKLEAILVTENSPYAEVRANVEPTDDPNMPSFTFRAWVIGVIFSGLGAFVNQLFSVRQPAVYIPTNVAQLLAHPLGKFMARVLPDYRFKIFGREHSLNPGPWNPKEHMLITIMANVAFNTPYTGYTVFIQALPIYFNQPYAYGFGYQLLSSLGSNFLGYGLAGMSRRFLVYPSHCVWPTSLSTMALLKAFHTTTNEAVPGPFGKLYTWSREKFFLITFAAMFVYWWFPGYIFQALSYFNWISWIAPNNQVLNNIVGSVNGLGLNPWTTFDFNIASTFFIPFVLPTFTVINLYAGMILSFFMIVAWYYSNAWNTGYLPINSNHTFDNTGHRYNVSKVLDAAGDFDYAKYQEYSEPWMAAGNLINYFWFFAGYSSTLVYIIMYYRYPIAVGFKQLWRSMRRSRVEDEGDDIGEDVHYRLMKQYKEVPEWWFAIVLVLATVVGMVGVGAYPTGTSPVVIVYGILMALICIIPTGIIYSITGIQVTMNVLAEFIGGSLVEGNAIALNFFKMYGYITTASALFFAGDLKLAHYAKIPPRHTFMAQMIATFISTVICTALFDFQMGFNNICTADADFGFSCPGQNTFFTAAVFWGTLSPKRLFGKGKRYNFLLLGFPVGVLLPFISAGLRRAFPRNSLVRQIHPVMISQGGLLWAPYNLSYVTPGVYLTLLSWQYVRKRYLAFWSKYNYVLAASWSAAIAIAAIVIFFGLEIPNGGISINWWGNEVSFNGCEGLACRYLEVPEVGYFGNAPGTDSFT